MLFIKRRIGQSIRIGDDIVMTVTNISGKSVRLSFDNPQKTQVLRQELYERICKENQAALYSSHLINEI